jgi:hypothetical protein
MLTGRAPEDLPHKGLAVDVRGALSGRSERLAGVLESMLDPDPDRRASRIAPLLERHGERSASRPPERSQREERRDDRRERHARRDARRRARRDQRPGHVSRGIPFPFSLVFGIVIAAGMLAVAVATQVVVPIVLTLLSIFFARQSLRTAVGNVREAGRTALGSLERSRQWVSGEEPEAARDPQVRVDAEQPAPPVRVADDEPADDETEEQETGSKSRRL